MLTSPIPGGDFERRLDQDIAQLTEACNRLLDCKSIVITIESIVLTRFHTPAGQLQQPGSAADPPTNAMNRQYSEPAGNRVTPPAHHPTNHWPTDSRSQGPPHSLNIGQVPPTRPQQPHSWSAPSSACVPLSVQHPYDYPPPPPYGQICPYPQFREDQRMDAQAAAVARAAAVAQSAATNTQRNANDDEEDESISGSEVDEGEQPLDKWPCIMCTFLNHPQLNVCETCENVRIQPGMIHIVRSGTDNANNASPPAAAAPTLA